MRIASLSDRPMSAFAYGILCTLPILLVVPFGAAFAYPASHGPFASGEGPRRATLLECVFIEHPETRSDRDSEDEIREYTAPDDATAPIVVLRTSELEMDISVRARGGALLSAPISAKSAPYATKIYTDDFNRDGTPDFFVRLGNPGGTGLASFKTWAVFLISNRESYEAINFEGFEYGVEDIIRIRPNGPWYFIRNELKGAEEKRNGGYHNFWVYQLYRFDGSEMKKANEDDPRFPKFVWYTHKENHQETRMLSQEKKKQLLEEN